MFYFPFCSCFFLLTLHSQDKCRLVEGGKVWDKGHKVTINDELNALVEIRDPEQQQLRL